MVPPGGEVAAAVAVVLLALVGAALAAAAARRTRNWLLVICVAGLLAVAAGVVGQRSFPGQAATAREGAAAAGDRPGPWDAGVAVPLLGLHITPVALGGVVVAVSGLSLVLFFEPVVAPAPPAAGRRREDADLP